MNVCLELSQIFMPNVYFLDAKQNMIIDGKFTQLVYSDEYFSMNGISILLPFSNWRMDTTMNQIKYLNYQNNAINQEIVNRILELESIIIDIYRKKNDCNKRPSNSLKYQLQSGSLKINKNYYSIHQQKVDHQAISRRKYVIKMSGIWESEDEVGVTFKFSELYEL